MNRRACFRAVTLLFAGLLCCAIAARGQAQLGDNVLLNLDGNLATGYSGSYTNEGVSSHGIGVGGNGNLSGSYFSPQFLSFDIAPFYDQSRNSSNYSSQMDSTGVTATTNLFSGSHFPGSVSYSRIYNAESDYLLPGTGNFKTNGNNQTFGINWTANLEHLPIVTAGYQQGNSDNSLYGAKSDSLSDVHSLYGNINYMVDGFHLGGGIHHSNQSTQFPELFASQPVQTAGSDATTYTANASRSLFLSGNTWVNFTRSDTSYDAAKLSDAQTADMVNGGFALKPLPKLNTEFSMDYNDSLAGSIYQAVNSNGVQTPVSMPAGASRGWGFLGQAEYTIFQGLYVTGGISRREQLFLGNTYDSLAYNGSLSFGHDLLGGKFSASTNVSHSALASGQSMLGLISSASYYRTIARFNLSGSFNYSQNVQTLLIAYTSSGYGYSGSVNRTFGKLNWSASAGGSRTLLTQENGTANSSQNYSTGLSGRWLSASAGYSRSSGIGQFTNTGISTLPPGVPIQLLPTAVLYGGTAYTFGLGSTPIRGLTVNGSYTKARNNTINGTLLSDNRMDTANAYLSYRFRKMYFNAGYSRLLQGFSGSGFPPAMVSSYYFSISRWFKFF